MATVKKSTHGVGSLNSHNVIDIPEVFAGTDLENYTLVELSTVGGVRTSNYLNGATKKPYLACAVEIMYDGEQYKEFYIGQGEAHRTVEVKGSLRFDTSNYTQISGTAPAKGQFASWDFATKKFVLSATVPATPAGGVHFEVVDVDGYGNLGLPTVRLEAQ